jgi:hypothetical protein
MLAEMGVYHLVQAPTYDIAQLGAEEEGSADNSRSLPCLVNGAGEDVDQEIGIVAHLQAEVRALKGQMEELMAKNLVTLDDADHLAQKVKAKMTQQREEAAKMNAELAAKVTVAEKKHDELDKHVKGELAAKVTAASKKQDALDKHVKGELASLNAKYNAQQKQMDDLAKKVEKPAAPFSSIQLRSAQELQSSFSQSSQPQPGFQNPRLAQSVSSSSAQKRNRDSLDWGESPTSKRSASTLAEQTSQAQSLQQSGRRRAAKATLDKPAPAQLSIRNFSFDE